MENNCIYFGVLGSYSNDSKTSVLNTWKGSTECSEEKAHEIVNLLLSNAKEQPSGFFQRFPLANISIPENNWTIFSSSFVINQAEVPAFYCFALVLDSSQIDGKPILFDTITESVGYITLFLHTIMKHGKKFEDCAGFIRNTFETINKLSIIKIPNELTALPELSKAEKEFFSIILTSHLETQMSTIIESNNKEEVLKIIEFLSHFTLPYQLEMSSLEMNDAPIPGLYIQWVKPQKSIPLIALAGFQRQWTYINVDKKLVRQSPDWDTQRSTRLMLRQAHLMAIHPGQSEAKKKVNAVMAKYRIKYIQDPAKWATDTINTIYAQEGEKRQFVAEIKFSEIIHEALSVIKFAEDLMNEKQQTFLSSEHVQFMNKMLGIDDDDLRMAVGVSTAFDPKISSTVYTGCQAVIKKMLNAV